MNTLLKLSAGLSLFIVLVFASCNDKKEEEVAKNIEQTNNDLENKAKDIDNDMRKERDEFVAEVNLRIEKNKKDIEDLKERSKNKSKSAKEDYDKRINELETKNESLKSKLNDYKGESAEGWRNFKEEFNHDMNELGTAIGDVFKDNK